ncbi:hypothetical protein M1L60_44650 [Actinoplanes sp. TRM 88003]|uniref:Uncharacterized protein n=1 Tax=Paractinoplanes aksuensis TaxID=2939490 RepID=A0ABT1E3L0_9ACTN|nr:hypothetical protein [Actinoplanes aksuensis]
MPLADTARAGTVEAELGDVPGAALARAGGLPRRYVDRLPGDGFTSLNTVSTVGSLE